MPECSFGGESILVSCERTTKASSAALFRRRKLTNASRGRRRRRSNDLEIAASYFAKPPQFVIVPPVVGSAGNKPVAAIVREKHSVGFQRVHDNGKLGRPVRAIRRLPIRPQPHAHSERRRPL